MALKLFPIRIPPSTLPNRIQPERQSPATRERQIVTDLIHHRIWSMFPTGPFEPSRFYDVPINYINTPTCVLNDFKHNMHDYTHQERYTPKVRKYTDCQMEQTVLVSQINAHRYYGPRKGEPATGSIRTP